MSHFAQIELAVCGFYMMEAIKVDADGNEISRRTLADWFPNLITNQGLDRMGGNNSYISYCAVGTGSTAPAFTDTTLVTPVAYTNTTQSSSISAQPSSPYYIERTVTKRFAVGTAAGNLSEVGMGWSNGPSTLYSRALILDGGGSPTTITVLSDEILDVTYRWRIYVPLTDVTGTITISGSNYDYTIRAAEAASVGADPGGGWFQASTGLQVQCVGGAGRNSAYSSAIAAITGVPTGLVSHATSVTNAAYGTNNLYRDATILWDLTAGSTSFRTLLLRFSIAEFQIEFNPVIPKLNTNNFSLTVRFSWTRA